MGTTIKRQPINFKIPNSPDYKYLNITDFGGIVETENPLEAPQNTASDCLNVYVDDFGILSTRPRLEPVFNFKENVLSTHTLLNVYPLNNRTLLQTKKDNVVSLYVMQDSVLHEVEVPLLTTISAHKLGVFEHDSKIFFVDGNGYYVIKDVNGVLKAFDVVNDSDTFVPTTHTGIIVNGKKILTEIASANTLTDKYRIDYSWDGVTDITTILKDDGKLIKNDYLSKVKTQTEWHRDSVGGTVLFNDNNDIYIGGGGNGGVSTVTIPITLRAGSELTEWTAMYNVKFTTSQKLDIGDQLYVDGDDSGTVVAKDPVSGDYVLFAHGASSFLYNSTVERTLDVVRVSAGNNKNIIGRLVNDAFVPSHEFVTTTSSLMSKQLTTCCDIDYSGRGFWLTDLQTDTSRYYHASGGSGLNMATPYNDRYVVLENGLGIIGVFAQTPSHTNWTVTKLIWDNTARKYNSTVLYNNANPISDFVDTATLSDVYITYDHKSDTLVVSVIGTNVSLIIKNAQSDKPTVTQMLTSHLGKNFRLTSTLLLSANGNQLIIQNLNKTDSDTKYAEKSVVVFPDTIALFETDNNDAVTLVLGNGSQADAPKQIYKYDLKTNTYFKLIDLLKHAEYKDYPDNNFFLCAMNTDGSIIATHAWYDYNYLLSEYGFREFIFDTIKTSTTPLLTKEYSFKSDTQNTNELQHEEYVTSFEEFNYGPIEVDFTTRDPYQALGYIFSKTTGEELSFPIDFDLSDNEVHFGTAGGNDYAYQYVDGVLRIGNYYSYGRFGYSGSGFRKIRLVVTYKNKVNEKPKFFTGFDSVYNFNNRIWFYGDSNKIRWSDVSNPTYVKEYDYADLGDEGRITDMLMSSYDTLLIFKNNGFYVTKPTVIKDVATFVFNENKTDNGATARNVALVSPLSEIPLFFNNKGVYTVKYLTDVQTDEQNTVLFSEPANHLYENKIQSNEILSLKYKNWVLIINPHQQHSDVLVYDDKRSSWFFWTLPIATVSAWTHNDVVNLCDSDGVVYELKTTDKTHEFNALLTEYYDYVDGNKLNIEWFWKSQVLHLNTVNYTKRLLDTTFILNDTDDTDEYGFDYKFKAYRRAVSDSNAVTINGSLNKVRSITKKTPVSRFGFLQLTLCNSVEDTNNKLHLSAIGLKYELLGGLLL